jgi:LPXTG-site transpeptidase (sortase) family protein
MSTNDYYKKDEDNTELPLPGEAGEVEHGKKDEANPAAADLIRKKVEAAYLNEPSAREEVSEIKELPKSVHRTKHQQFIYELMNSGKPMHEIQTAWHEYYASLVDSEKHSVWQEFYKSHSPLPAHQGPVIGRPLEPVTISLKAKHRVRAAAKRLHNTRQKVIADQPKPKLSLWQSLHSLLFGLSIGCLVVFIVLFSFFNERFIAPFIQPSRNVSNNSIIVTNATVSPDPEVIIPKINVEVPVVYGMDSIDENDVQKALENGVLHYADTSEPGENGNVVIIGHSAVNVFNAGKYKFAFILLHKVEVGDTFYLQKDGKRYAYQVYDKEVVKPSDVGVLSPKPDQIATATLITCDPPGYNSNRMVIIGKQINPDPSSNLAAKSTNNTVSAQTAVVPGNSQSLWSRLTSWL